MASKEAEPDDPVENREPYVSIFEWAPTDDGRWRVSEDGADAVGVGDTPTEAFVAYVREVVPTGAWE